MKNLVIEDGAKKKVQSIIWDFLHTNKWLDSDDFSLEISDKLYEMLQQDDLSIENVQRILNGIRTTFFRINKLSKKKFSELLISDVSNKLKKTMLGTHSGVLLSQLNPIRILFLTANPKNTVSLRLDEEVRDRKQDFTRPKKGSNHFGQKGCCKDR